MEVEHILNRTYPSTIGPHCASYLVSITNKLRIVLSYEYNLKGLYDFIGFFLNLITAKESMMDMVQLSK